MKEIIIRRLHDLKNPPMVPRFWRSHKPKTGIQEDLTSFQEHKTETKEFEGQSSQM